MTIEKPVIFISHAATDEPIARILKAEIDRIFANGVEVFASSVTGVIKPGEDWLATIKANLERAQAVIVLLTPISLNRPWIWFETGASWSRMSEKHSRIYPLCAAEIDKNDIPAPLNSLQALSLGSAGEIKLFFQTLCEQFGFGNMKGFKAATIKTLMPKYESLKVQEVDLQSGTIYNGPYEGYSDEELQEILADEFVKPHMKDGLSWRGKLKHEKLLHFAKIDEERKLPPGTSKRLLVGVVGRYGINEYSGKVKKYIPNQLFDNSVRFALSPVSTAEAKSLIEFNPNDFTAFL